MVTIHDVCEHYKREISSINKISGRYERALHKILYKLDHSFNIYEGCKYKHLGFEKCPKVNINNIILKKEKLCQNAQSCCIYHILLDALNPAEQKKLELWKLKGEKNGLDDNSK